MCSRLLLLACPFLQGCLAFAYPCVTQTPTVVAETPEVRAFHVQQGYTRYGFLIAGAFECFDSIQEIRHENGVIPAKYDGSMRYHYVVFPVAGGHERSQEVRLYRRGYETKVLPARHWIAAPLGEHRANLDWVAVSSFGDREKAIDNIHAGLVAVREPEICNFLAEEYLTLAEDLRAAQGDEESLQRVREKAEKIKARK